MNHLILGFSSRLLRNFPLPHVSLSLSLSSSSFITMALRCYVFTDSIIILMEYHDSHVCQKYLP